MIDARPDAPKVWTVADIVVITGLSGAGRSATAAVLEDLGWYVVDNLPTSLVPTIVELAAKPGAGIDPWRWCQGATTTMCFHR